MLTLALILALCDLGLIAWLRREKRAHRKSRNALDLALDAVRHWRNLHTDATSRLRDVRGQNGVRDVRVSRVRGKGGEAA